MREVGRMALSELSNLYHKDTNKIKNKNIRKIVQSDLANTDSKKQDKNYYYYFFSQKYQLYVCNLFKMEGISNKTIVRFFY